MSSLAPQPEPLQVLDNTGAHVCEEKIVTCGAFSHARERVSTVENNSLTYARARIGNCATRHTSTENQLFDCLAAVFGVPAFRDHQVRAIEAALNGQDVLVIAPTSGGKSLGFWGAGLARGGLTIVVSPLRSLMADQVRRLTTLNLPVRLWNSDVSDADKDETLELLRKGWQGFLYTTPESLKGQVLSSVLIGRVDLAVIDEAHCVLRERGFRVDYAQLGHTLDRLGPRVLYACTATLPANQQRALVGSLKLRDPMVIRTPVARDNLVIQVIERNQWELATILDRHHHEPGIIFCATVQAAEKVHGVLRSQGRRVGLYHGRLKTAAKRTAQDDFMSGRVPVAVVTDAFLLGIDKADIRFIVHYDHPKSVEDWCQGFGRAGRDGLPARIYGCFTGNSEGRASREFLINATYPSLDNVRRVWEYLISAPFRAESKESIGEKGLGSRHGKYCGPAAITVLLRHQLATAEFEPEDGRRRIYRGRGDFDATDWTVYEAEASEARSRFQQFCELVRLPEPEIPEAIDRYFDSQPGLRMSEHGDWPASWEEV